MKKLDSRRLHQFIRRHAPSLYRDLTKYPALELYLMESWHWINKQRDLAIRDAIDQFEGTTFAELLDHCRQAAQQSTEISLELIQIELADFQEAAALGYRYNIAS